LKFWGRERTAFPGLSAGTAWIVLVKEASLNLSDGLWNRLSVMKNPLQEILVTWRNGSQSGGAGFEKAGSMPIGKTRNDSRPGFGAALRVKRGIFTDAEGKFSRKIFSHRFQMELFSWPDGKFTNFDGFSEAGFKASVLGPGKGNLKKTVFRRKMDAS